MATSGFKPTAPPVKAVRKQACRLLDAAMAALSPMEAEPDRPTARRELLRYQSMLELVRRPLGRDVYKRERGVVTQTLRRLAEPDCAAMRLLDWLVKESQEPPADDVLQSIKESLQPQREKPLPTAVPDPAVLRVVADLAEARMRCRYWHLPGEGFEVFASGLRTSYGRASRSLGEPEDAVKAAGDARQLANHLRLLERAWPAVLVPYRKAVRGLMDTALTLAACDGLRPHLPQDTALLAALDAHREALLSELAEPRGRVFAESSSAFARRVGAYWAAAAGGD